MKLDSKAYLNSIVKTAQMGQIGIRSVLNQPVRASLRSTLKAQLHEYDQIEQEAMKIAGSNGWKLDELNPMVKTMTNFMTKARLTFGDTSAKAAAMMIQGNTRGIIKGYKNMHNNKCSDDRVNQLQAKLLSHEEEYTKQMQGFL